MTAEEQVKRLLSRCSSLLEHSDFVYGKFDNLQPDIFRELPALKLRLDAFVDKFKDESWKIEFLTCQDFVYPRTEIPNELISIIGNQKRLALLNSRIWTDRYQFLDPLIHANGLDMVKKWPRGQSKTISFTHKDVELDLVGVVLFLTKVCGYQQNAVFQFIAIHGSEVDTDSGRTDSGQLSRAADKIRKSFEGMHDDWWRLDFPKGTLQCEVREIRKEE
ncbi:hypothetical protein L1P06_03885 [Edwardsiella piscicida]|uniref:hypothetical protein n=1 Tax=Edwardsiella piscicida TaxID=1263550 RepID=UPI001F37A265|nr:hypothetical protein [Edwardsiella piscicida]UJT79727.1 hypothetical protein L1P06_03885 [Edwardsiella piscicida]